MDSVYDRQKGVATIFDYVSFSSAILADNLRQTIGIEYCGVVNIYNPAHVQDFEQWATHYTTYEAAIQDFVRVGYWPVLLAPYNNVADANKVQYLTDYDHPPKAVYITGPDEILGVRNYSHDKLIELCNDVVTIPSDNRELHAMSALTCALWDRTLKNNLVSYYYNNRGK